MRKKYNESDIRNDYRRLTKLLIERGMTISTMESATSGQIASLITDTEGSSAVLKGAFVTYCNEAKIMQGCRLLSVWCLCLAAEKSESAWKWQWEPLF